jgi:hypothetical protein
MPKSPSRKAVCSFDLLEKRQLFSAVNEVLIDKVNPRLLHAVKAISRGEENYDIKVGNVKVDPEGAVQVYLDASGSLAEMNRGLASIGLSIEMSVDEAGLAQAWIPASMIDDVAMLLEVEHVDLPIYAIPNVTSAGDGILLADKVRSQFAAMGIDGSGIKIGVISDGVNHKANVGAELPTVTVNPTIPGSGDEGTAMLEIVHDLAPGAQLYFSGPNTSVSMVNSINWLVGQGCDIIVDDLGFLDQSFFADDTIAAACTSAISSGVTYLSAAGNFSSESHWQGSFITGLSATVDGRYHKFAPDDANNITIGNGDRVRIFLQWSDAQGASNNNYDLHLYNSSTFALLDTSTTVQNGNDDPFEWLDYTNNTGSTITGSLYVEKKNTAAIREMELFVIGASSMEFETQGDAIFGHQATQGVMAIAAANAGSSSTVTSYSSRGPATIYTNFATQTKTTRDPLDGLAIDGVQTQAGVLGWFNNPFYGTSAAAPHAAAIAALVLDANPSLTPAQVAQIMADTATDISTVGYDQNSGAGRYNALDAVYKAFTPAAPDLTSGTDSGVSNSDNVTKNANPTFTGTVPAASYVRLFIDNVERGAVQLGAGVTTFNLAVNGGALANGAHNAQVRIASSSTVALANNASFSGALPFTVDTVSPTFNVASFNVNFTPMNLSFNFSEKVQDSIVPGDLTLTNQTLGGATVPAASMAVSYNPAGTTAFVTFPGYPGSVLPDGNYTALLPAANVTDVAGNAVTGANISYDFFFQGADFDRDRDVDTLDFNLLAGNFTLPGSKIFQQGDANYDATVDSLDFNVFLSKYGSKLPAPGPVVMSAAPSSLFASQAVTGEAMDEALLAVV